MQPLDDPETLYVRLAWIDLVNCLRYRVIPITHFRALTWGQNTDSDAAGYDTSAVGNGAIVTNTHPGIHVAKVVVGMVDLMVPSILRPEPVSTPALEGQNQQGVISSSLRRPLFSATGEYVLVPDYSSASRLQYAASHAICFGWLEEKTARVTASDGSLLRNPFEATLCPRSILRRVVESAYRSHGAEFLVGFETEVIFLRKDAFGSPTKIKGANEYGFSESYALLADDPETLATSEIADALQKAGIELQMYHSEAAPGQFEFVTGPLRPLEACDALIVTRDIIRNITNKHGFCATIAPRIFPNTCGSAAHAHISISSSRTHGPIQRTHVPDLTGLTALSKLEQSFLEGLLGHLRGAVALTLPTSASYARVVDGAWTGGTYISWGRDNREVPVRVCGRGTTSTEAKANAGRNMDSPDKTGYVDGGSRDAISNRNPNAPDNMHFEVKCMDGTACPHLAIAGLLAAGMLGVRENAPLTHVGIDLPASVIAKASDSGDQALAELGITRRMPFDVSEARQALREDTALVDALGGLESVVRPILAVQELLDNVLDAPTEEERIQKLIMKF